MEVIEPRGPSGRRYATSRESRTWLLRGVAGTSPPWVRLEARGRSESALDVVRAAAGGACFAGAGRRLGAGRRGTGAARRVGKLDDRQQAGPRDIRRHVLKSLVHAVGRGLERGLLPARRHRSGAVPGARG